MCINNLLSSYAFYLLIKLNANKLKICFVVVVFENAVARWSERGHGLFQAV